MEELFIPWRRNFSQYFRSGPNAGNRQNSWDTINTFKEKIRHVRLPFFIFCLQSIVFHLITEYLYYVVLNTPYGVSQVTYHVVHSNISVVYVKILTDLLIPFQTRRMTFWFPFRPILRPSFPQLPHWGSNLFLLAAPRPYPASATPIHSRPIPLQLAYPLLSPQSYPLSRIPYVTWCAGLVWCLPTSSLTLSPSFLTPLYSLIPSTNHLLTSVPCCSE